MKIENKNIILLLPGSSLKELHQHMPIENVLWASLNRFSFIERHLLKPYGKELDLVWCSSSVRFEEEKQNIFQHLKSGKIFYTNHELYLQNRGLFSHFPKQIICSSEGHGLCSLFCFLAILIKQNAKKIILVGADGKADLQVYYNDSELINEDLEERRKTILRDTKIFNKIFWDCIKIWYPPTSTEIINTNRNSAYTIFPYQSLENIKKEL